MARRLFTALAVFCATAAPAQAELVQLARGHEQDGATLARAAGGEELVPELRLWRVPAYALPTLRRARAVAISRPERVLTPAAATAQATDPLVPAQWWRAAIGADAVEPPGPGKPITVVDSGLDVTHPEFASRPNTIVLNRQTVDDEEEDHGTEVSSVIAAPNNGVGIVGVYPEAILRVWDASPFGILNEGAAIQGIVDAARNGPGVINLSFGGEDDDPLLHQAILLAFRSGSLVVAAAGNEGLEGSPKGFPAAYTHVLTVGATNESGRVASFSTIAPTVDLVAPGVRIPVAEPLERDASGFTFVPGTSFSAPLVAGSAAWVWTTRPELDNTQLFELMRRSTTDIGVPGFDEAAGYGLLNIPRALSFKTPLRDLQEPNETPDEIEPRRTFSTGNGPLTTAVRLTATVTARADRSEDPVDLYRIWAPSLRTVRAQTTGAVAVRLLPRVRSLTARTRPLAVGRGGVATYRAARGAYVYVEVRPLARTVEYTLRLTAARR